MYNDLKVLLWAFGGAGESYWGPGISAYNLYRSGHGKHTKFSVDLAHGFREQQKYDVFKNSHLISALQTDRGTQAMSGKLSCQTLKRFHTKVINEPRFLYHSYHWVKHNINRYDVAHCLSSFHVSFLPALWIESFGKPAFIKVTSEDPLPVESSFSKLIGLHKRREASLNKISGYIAVSKEIRDSLSNVGIEDRKIHLISNGVNVTRFAPLTRKMKFIRREKYKLKDDVVFIFTGAITARKNPSAIVKACGCLKHTFKNFHLLLVGPARGNDEEFNRILELTKQHNLKSQITILDFTVEIEKLYQIADVFILPSKKEGMSNSLLEAMSTGLPAIVTKVSGMSDLVIENVNGFYIEDDYLDLARKMAVYLKQKNLIEQHGRAAREHIFANFSDQTILKKHHDLFERHKRLDAS